MEWTNKDVLAVASSHCAQCEGQGFIRKADGTYSSKPCTCVIRKIFSLCYKRFRECNERPKFLSQTSLTRTSGPQGGRQVWGRKTEEFLADFIGIAKRTLRFRSFEWTVFKYHYLLGADQALICRQMRITKDQFFNTQARIIQKLGRAYRETAPYSLYPLDEYFSNTVVTGRIVALELPVPHFIPVRPPVLKAA